MSMTISLGQLETIPAIRSDIWLLLEREFSGTVRYDLVATTSAALIKWLIYQTPDTQEMLLFLLSVLSALDVIKWIDV